MWDFVFFILWSISFSVFMTPCFIALLLKFLISDEHQPPSCGLFEPLEAFTELLQRHMSDYQHHPSEYMPLDALA